jgi:hypothetical protein
MRNAYLSVSHLAAAREMLAELLRLVPRCRAGGSSTDMVPPPELTCAEGAKGDDDRVADVEGDGDGDPDAERDGDDDRVKDDMAVNPAADASRAAGEETDEEVSSKRLDTMARKWARAAGYASLRWTSFMFQNDL